MNKKLNIQDSFLNYVRKNKIKLTICLFNGETIEGFVKGFDNFVIVVKDGNQKLVYKHAVAYLVPCQEIDISFD